MSDAAAGQLVVQKTPFKSWLKGMHARGVALNEQNILGALRTEGARYQGKPCRFLDMGCDDGAWTLRLADSIRAGGAVVEVFGVEKVAERATLARKRGVEVAEADLAQRLPFADASFDVVHSNQVIEHVPGIDLFVGEMFRVLKPGGTFVCSSENGSAWHNIAAAILGWQIFSLTNVSSKVGALGNPLAMHRGEGGGFHEAWTHKTIFNYLGFREIFQVHGGQGVTVLGAGYYPLPAQLGLWDPRHAHFLTAVGRKTNS